MAGSLLLERQVGVAQLSLLKSYTLDLHCSLILQRYLQKLRLTVDFESVEAKLYFPDILISNPQYPKLQCFLPLFFQSQNGGLGQWVIFEH
jgi:hypothetical protein